MQEPFEDYRIVLAAVDGGWSWTLSRRGGDVAARGEAADAETARRSGLITASLLAALRRSRRV